jgi:hypothetical protein
MAISSIAKESTWLEMLGKDLRIDVPKSTILHNNNKVSMKMANNLQITPLNKHIGVHFYYTQDKIAQRDLKFNSIFIDEQVVNVFMGVHKIIGATVNIPKGPFLSP